MAAVIRDNALERLLVYANVAPGDVLFIPAGTIHALGPGILLYEIQQSSDTTYRLYDWGRLDLDGKPRPLHIEKGVSVSNVETLPEIRHTAGEASPQVEIVRSPYFVTVLHQLNEQHGAQADLDTGGSRFHALTCIQGQARVEADGAQVDIHLGQTILVPACVGRYTLSGAAQVLRAFQP
jgi:mannose-6-phosphate isomerase